MAAIAGYPQMPPFTPDEVEAFLTLPIIARLGTTNADNTVHMAPIYFRYENGEFILGTQQASRRVRNIQRNPNVTLLIDDTTPPFKSVLVYGTAVLDYDQVVEKRTMIFLKYYNSLERARNSAEGLCAKWKSVIIHIKPDQMISFDYSKANVL